MKNFGLLKTAGLTAVVFTALCATPMQARCLSRPGQQPLRRTGKTPSALAIRTAPPVFPGDSAPAAEPSIAGFWYMRTLSGGKLVDDGFDMWLADGTEILNDTTAPSSGAVCLGVWTKTAPLTYELKHPSWIFDDTNTTLIGIVIIYEKVILDPGGNSYSGTVTINAYDLAGNVLDTEQFDLTGERMTALVDPADTSAIPGLPKSVVSR
jgi:hypothetical protein